MGYDITLRDADTGDVLKSDKLHKLSGSTYAKGGTYDLWLSVTYNYNEHYKKVFGEKGIRTIYGMSGKDSVPILKKAISLLEDDKEIVHDYYAPTEGNAKRALCNLLEMAKMGPAGIWCGD